MGPSPSEELWDLCNLQNLQLALKQMLLLKHCIPFPRFMQCLSSASFLGCTYKDGFPGGTNRHVSFRFTLSKECSSFLRWNLSAFQATFFLFHRSLSYQCWLFLNTAFTDANHISIPPLIILILKFKLSYFVLTEQCLWNLKRIDYVALRKYKVEDWKIIMWHFLAIWFQLY